jgi:branched-chain amino acid transport system permease protein
VHYGPFGATMFAIVVTVMVGSLFGVAVCRASGLAPTMITLAALFMVEQVVKNWKELTRGAGGLSGVPRLEGNGWLWVGAFVALVVAHLFQETRIGRFAIATREDELAAPALGIRLFSSRYAAWVVSMALIALGGSLRAQSLGSVNPKQFTLDAGILILVMLVVGGMRTVSGAVLGTVLITAGNELFRQLGDPQRWGIERFPDLFLGGTMLLVMVLRPGGLLGDRDLAAWLRRRPTAARTPGVSAGGAHVVALTATEIEVRFGGFIALDDAGLTVRPGEVVGLIGPNGAGKTTLFNVITGIVHEQGGRVTLGDRELTDAKPVDVARAGLARTFQNLRLFKNLSVRENVALTSPGRRPPPQAIACARMPTRCSPTPASPTGPIGRRHAGLRQPAPAGTRPRRRAGPRVPAARRADQRHERPGEPGDGGFRPRGRRSHRRRRARHRPRPRVHHPHQRPHRRARRGPRVGRGHPPRCAANPLVAEAYLGSSA